MFYFSLKTHRLELERHLPAEPDEGCTEPMIKIRYKLPEGGMIERRFLAKEKLKVCKAF